MDFGGFSKLLFLFFPESYSHILLNDIVDYPAISICQDIKTDSAQSLSNKCKNYLLKIYSQHIN